MQHDSHLCPSQDATESLPVEFSRLICPAQLKFSEMKELSLMATKQECVGVATRAGLLEVRHLIVHAEMSHHKRGWRLSGVVQADVVQTCVVSLDPFTSVLSSDFEVEIYKSEDNSKIDENIMPDETDIEVLTNGCFDLGEIATQYLCLALDDHPKKSDLEDFQAYPQHVDLQQEDISQNDLPSPQGSSLEVTESPLASALKAAQEEKERKKTATFSR